MFDFFSWQHLSIMLVVALVVVGPKDLPRLMNMAGKWAGKARAMATEFRRSFDEVNSSMEAVSAAPAPEAEIVEPRSGEFAVTESAPHPRNTPIVETP